jgi:hypothetical protein
VPPLTRTVVVDTIHPLPEAPPLEDPLTISDSFGKSSGYTAYYFGPSPGVLLAVRVSALIFADGCRPPCIFNLDGVDSGQVVGGLVKIIHGTSCCLLRFSTVVAGGFIPTAPVLRISAWIAPNRLGGNQTWCCRVGRKLWLL